MRKRKKSVGTMSIGNAAERAWQRFNEDRTIRSFLTSNSGITVAVARIQNPAFRIWSGAGESNRGGITLDTELPGEKLASQEMRWLAQNPLQRISAQACGYYSATAVRGSGLFVSVTGLKPNSLNEAFGLLFLVEIGDLSLREVRGILKK